jgi:hypothetical protein
MDKSILVDNSINSAPIITEWHVALSTGRYY